MKNPSGIESITLHGAALETGVFLGINGRTDDYIIGDAQGIHKTRAIRRKTDDERWDKKELEAITPPSAAERCMSAMGCGQNHQGHQPTGMVQHHD